MAEKTIDKGLAAYFQLNAENYAGLIDELLDDTANIHAELTDGDAPPSLDAAPPSLDAKLIAARRAYFEIAIAKGADLAELPRRIVSLSAEQLAEAAREIPDKYTDGWIETSLSKDDRKSFADAAAKRTPAMRWDNLFEAGKNEVVLPFLNSAQSADDKVQAFIYRHNEMAAKNLAAAQGNDEEALRQNPDARVTAGRSIEQRQIRLDPALEAGNPTRLQTLNPWKDVWEPGPKLSKFLQNQYVWDLFDLIQDNAEVKKSLPAEPKNIPADLKAIANSMAQNTDDLLDNAQLRIVISRDPQKIGEMSTGQRWRSCMALDGINYRYVPKDIEAGSLVAYVVHKDDPEARYPLMRQLLKPFRNKKGETILVPAKIYGGEGSDSSRTRDALKLTLNAFVVRQNAGKAGEFKMDGRLYADGQATTARLDNDWTEDGIIKAVVDYRKGALQEWITEIKGFHLNFPFSPDHLPPDNPAVIDFLKQQSRFKKQKSKIQRVFDVENMETGLPRIFFREMQQSSLGSIPTPRGIVKSIADNEVLRIESVAFKALTKGDEAVWDQVRGKLSEDMRKNLPLYVIASAEPGSKDEQTAITVWKKETDMLPSVERMRQLRNSIQLIPYCESLKSYAALELIKATETVKISNSYALFILRQVIVHFAKGSEESLRAVRGLIHHARKIEPTLIKTAVAKVLNDDTANSDYTKAVERAIDHAPEGSVEQNQAMKMGLRIIDSSNTLNLERIYEKIARYFPIESAERALAIKKILSLPLSKKGSDCYVIAAELACPATPLYWTAHAKLIKHAAGSFYSDKVQSYKAMQDVRARLMEAAKTDQRALKLFIGAGDVIMRNGLLQPQEKEKVLNENESLGLSSPELALQTQSQRTMIKSGTYTLPQAKPGERLMSILHVRIAKAVQAVEDVFPKGFLPARQRLPGMQRS